MNPFKDYMHGYDLCNDVVAVYHYEDGEITKTVYERAYFDSKKTENIERTGSVDVNGFLIVIPGDVKACEVGDKVLLGGGVEPPFTDAASWWRSFIPSKVENLVVVRNVDVRRFGGKIVHTEASG